MSGSQWDELCTAAARGERDKVLDMLQQGVNVDGLNKFQRTALQVAQLGHGRLVRDLLEAGADPNRPDPVLRLTATHDAAREGFPESVRALLEHGADVNLPDAHGNLPLHLAAREGHLEVVELLGARTAHPGAANGQGRSARQLARDFGRARAAEYLQKHLESD
ncbi:cyclin-dependent kinase 4 inhibitor C isoform 1-T2 [Menidia menidia]